MLVLPAIPKVFTLEELDKTVYEHIRLALVAKGWMPDVLVHTTNAAFKTALEAIKTTTGNNPFYLYGNTPFEDKGEIKVNQVNIERDSSRSNYKGYDSFYILDEVNHVYEKYLFKAAGYDVNYVVQVVFLEQKDERKFSHLIYSVFDIPSEITVIDPVTELMTDKKLAVTYNNDQNLTIPEVGIHSYYFLFPDVLLGEIIKVDENIEPTEEIVAEIQQIDLTLQCKLDSVYTVTILP